MGRQLLDARGDGQLERRPWDARDTPAENRLQPLPKPRLEQKEKRKQDEQRTRQPTHQRSAGGRHPRTSPPFTCSVCPVMKAASSLVRNEMVPTRSDGTCPRGIACRAAAAANDFSISVSPGRGPRAIAPGVRVSAGAMAFTVMPCGPSSVASARVNPIMPPLLAM